MRMPSLRPMTSLALSGLGLILAAGPAIGHAAGEGDGHRGKVGRHAFIDSEERPGARCIYRTVDPDRIAPAALPQPAADAELVGVAVRPPRVAAIDRTPDLDRGVVGWRFILQERLPDGEWTRVQRSPLQLARTTDQRAADFSRMRVRHDGDPLAEYRVKTKAYWFKRRHRWIGVAAHLVDHYRVRGDITQSACPGSLPVPVVP